jgi:poly(hydroxyalkanoate) depolymerase family esterase
MSDQIQDSMAEAMRLVRRGRLNEATTIIQHTLGGASAAGADAPRAAVVVDEQPAEATSGRRCASGHERAATLQPAPIEMPLRSPEMSRLLDGLPGSMAGAKTGVPESAIVPPGGQFVERFYTNQAGTRAYKLYIPSGYTGQAAPLVVMLHGCTQNPNDLAAGTRMNALAETHTFLVAYPAQDVNANMSKCWNWFKTADQQRGQGEPSLIAGITRQILEEYNVDATRVYVAGMSAGGAMAAVMGATYPELYTAVGVHSGLAPGAAQDLSSAFAAMQNGGPTPEQRDTPTRKPTRVVPTIVFHGDNDTTVHPRNADHLLAHFVNFAGSRDVSGGQRLSVTTRQGQVPGGHAYTCATYHDAKERPIMEQWTVHGLGHAWSGGSLPGSYTDPKGPDASAEMVRFFRQHP